MSLNLATLLSEAAKRHPSKPAIVINDVVLPYQMVDGFARKFAGALHGLGVKPGQHVALMLPNVPQFTIAYFGSHYAACPVVPLNVLLTPDEIHYHLDDSEAVALVVWEGFFEQARAGFARSKPCVCTRPGSEVVTTLMPASSSRQQSSTHASTRPSPFAV